MEQLQNLRVSLISPSRNNFIYLKESYESVRKHTGFTHEYCVCVDYSDDGTEEWCEEISKKDKNFKYIVNDGTWFGENNGTPSRMGHVLLYDKLIEEVATNDVVMIWHTDMVCTKNMFQNMLKHLKLGVVVSATRIEPPLHPPGKEKIIKDFGNEPEEFDESAFNDFVLNIEADFENQTTDGIFAPFMIMKESFMEINGQDPLYFVQSREDSDLFNRLLLNGNKFIQSRDALCYHRTCRGSRYNPKLTTVGKESTEWLIQNNRSTRNFVRKWGCPPRNTEYLHPIIPHKYNISFVVKNCTMEILSLIEPYCDRVYLNNDIVRNQYVWDEQKATKYDMSKRVLKLSENDPKENDIIVEFDCGRLNQNNIQILQMLPDIINDSGEIGQMEFDIFKFKINSMKPYEYTLIKKVEK